MVDCSGLKRGVHSVMICRRLPRFNVHVPVIVFIVCLLQSGICGTGAPYYIKLGENQALPGNVTENITAEVCTITTVGLKVECGVACKAIEVMRCDGFYAYNIEPLDEKVCPAGICVKGTYTNKPF